VAKKAAAFLAEEPGKKILDIGSGVGKFCLIGAHFNPQAYFYGVEQRQDLYNYAVAAREATQTDNISFIYGNFAQLDFSKYDHFYFYNAFFENLDDQDRIDRKVDYSESLYVYYSRLLYKALFNKPSGTRLATFHSLEDEIPPGYQLVDASADFLLKMWIKR
jgi:SAM-dependent methyltransferase